jgi:hypothetical protein
MTGDWFYLSQPDAGTENLPDLLAGFRFISCRFFLFSDNFSSSVANFQTGILLDQVWMKPIY